MKRLLTILLGLAFSFTGFSQTCLPEGIAFYTQTDIDLFQVNYPNCKEIEGDVTIAGVDINDLNGLAGITSIGGELRIEWTDLSNLSGLDSLSYIGGDIWILNNNLLTSLYGLSNLSTIQSSIYLDHNVVLSSLSGLENLTNIKGSLIVSETNALSNFHGLEALINIEGNLAIGTYEGSSSQFLLNLTGLENLISIGGELRLSYTAMLNNFTGLNGLTSIGNSLSCVNNKSLENFTGLESLSSIGSNIWIDGNIALTSFTGLEQLSSIDGDFDIEWNFSLTSLTGLDNIAAGSIGILTIRDNPLLSDCNVKSLCNYLSLPYGITTILNNATGCDTQEEVVYACGLGLDEKGTSGSQFNIYPNPTSSQITLEISEMQQQSQLSIFNMNGQEFINCQIKVPRTVIDIGDLAQGIYYIKLKSESAMQVFKLVKE